MASPAADLRWTLLRADIADAVENLADGASLYRDGAPPPAARTLRRQHDKAFQKFLQDGYSSIERALIRVLEIFGEPPPRGQSWHSDLLRVAVGSIGGAPARPPFAPSLLADLRLLLQFRHVAMHGYSDFDLDMARPAAEAAARVAAALPEATEAFGRAAGLLPPA
jgi:hypothetical protein